MRVVVVAGLLFSLISHPEFGVGSGIPRLDFSSGWDPADLDQISLRGEIQIH